MEKYFLGEKSSFAYFLSLVFSSKLPLLPSFHRHPGPGREKNNFGRAGPLFLSIVAVAD